MRARRLSVIDKMDNWIYNEDLKQIAKSQRKSEHIMIIWYVGIFAIGILLASLLQSFQAMYSLSVLFAASLIAFYLVQLFRSAQYLIFDPNNRMWHLPWFLFVLLVPILGAIVYWELFGRHFVE